ncbi:MAG: hypothetical protein WC647_02250 [Desulfomonilaceae bacterium]|jgi:hypothetical protein
MNKSKKKIDKAPETKSLTDQILALANSELGKRNAVETMESARESLERIRNAKRRGSNFLKGSSGR